MVREVDPSEIARRLRTEPGRLLLLDVREGYERDVARIDPSLHIPMSEVPDRLAEIDAEREVVVYCHTGVRSAMVAGFLEQHGYRHVANLRGGVDAWSREVDPAVSRYG